MDQSSSIETVAERSGVAKDLHSQLASGGDDDSKTSRRIGIASSTILGCEETGLLKSWSSCIYCTGSKRGYVAELSGLFEGVHSQVGNGGGEQRAAHAAIGGG